MSLHTPSYNRLMIETELPQARADQTRFNNMLRARVAARYRRDFHAYVVSLSRKRKSK